jgi:HupE / UreJ protein
VTRSTRVAALAWLALVVALASGARAAHAHGFTPSLLELTERGGGDVGVLLKLPAAIEGEGLRPVFPPECADTGAHEVFAIGPDRLEAWTVRCVGGLAGHTLRVDGFSGLGQEMLVRVVLLGGARLDSVVRASQPSLTIPARQSFLDVARGYVALGVQHILTGYDHLAFVLGLLLLVRRGRALLATVTAFTVAHSVTLSAAALGVLRVPARPVEAAIALSIVLVAAEAERVRRGVAGGANVGRTAPWVVAFVFGLLHGLGFAGALADAGMAGAHLPAALLGFNIGVEVGQLAFVVPLFWLLRAADRLPAIEVGRARAALAYALGTLGAFYCFERIAAFSKAM